MKETLEQWLGQEIPTWADLNRLEYFYNEGTMKQALMYLAGKLK